MRVLAEDFPMLLNLLTAAGAPIKVNGPPGVGKSKGLEAWARSQGDDYGYFELDMSKANIADLQGYLMPTAETILDADGAPVEIMAGKYTYPYFLYDKFTKRPAHSYKRGVVVFEEWGQGDPEVKRAATPMIYERRLGLYEFKDFDVVILSNRPEDRSGVTKEYDFTINRWTEVDLVPTLKAFLEVSHTLGITTMTQAFAARNESILFDAEAPKKQGPWLTQRSLHRLDDIIKRADIDKVPLDSPVVLAAAAGTVGEAAAHIYMAFTKARAKIPTVSAIIADPQHAPIPEELDVTMFLVFDLAAKTKRENFTPIAAYVKRLSSDFAVTYFHAATTRDNSLVSTAEFSNFAVDNLTLLSAVVSRRA